MKDKDIQIEQMAKIMCGHDCEECAKETADWRGVSLEEAKAVQCLTKKGAELLYNAGCRIIPEGSVVLLREEYEKLTAPRVFIKPRQLNGEELAEKLKDFNYEIIGVDKSSIEIIPTRAEIEKETAEEICFKIIKDLPQPLQEKWKEFFAKEYGVEIKD